MRLISEPVYAVALQFEFNGSFLPAMPFTVGICRAAMRAEGDVKVGGLNGLLLALDAHSGLAR